MGLPGLSGGVGGRRASTASRRPTGGRVLDPSGLGRRVGRVLLTAQARARRLGDRWESTGLWAIFGGFGLIMLGVALAVAAE